MTNFDHPFLVKLHYSFQTSSKLFMVMDYCDKRDLGKHLNHRGTLSEHEAKILACELTLAIRALHSQNIVHRDIKTDNVLISDDGHIKLADFGLAKELSGRCALTHTFCGSVVYLPPEIIKKKGYCKTVDWYLLGEILYEVVIGEPPYYSDTKEGLFENILKKKLVYPPTMSSNLKDLIQKLLVRDPFKRLGSKFDADEIQAHPFFIGIDWDKVYNKGYTLFKPDKVKSYKLNHGKHHLPQVHSVRNQLPIPYWTYSRPESIFS